ncbi:metal ABC transporter solute-binding protein, Zn/Mn family [Pyrococcus abyssi]|uniref:ABC transporter, periplasmic binding protein n=1 Tax=Pyrococcus abyssi (strain GE5 / Orsay) TaxID=272844 RepID=Q9UYI2_PYRAB|nr:zinc ABC transporter substrate-binding protein [Pyrococcus abyssi]CAB50430.1 Putative adhesion lipoprotein [Pyrococcus abyssi GE5]CCE70979.1 TPA: ABC transporter, periplasmic binding protein [Pyrococcus abyssi GE5]
MKRLILIMFTLTLLLPPSMAQEKPLVVTSLPAIASIIREAFGDSVNVVYLVPPGVEPHQYQLSPSQIELLRKADVIVTTGHLPAEMKIQELKESGEIPGIVLGIEDYERYGFRYLPERWYEGKNNPHGIWLDPRNAIAIAKATANALLTLHPELKEINEELEDFELKINSIVEAYSGVLSGKKAIIELPSQQYALEWLGIEVVDSIKPEAEVPAKSVDSISAKADVVVYDVSTPKTLKDASVKLSEKLGVPLANVTVLWVKENYSKVLVENTKSIIRAMTQEGKVVVKSSSSDVGKYSVISLIVGIVVGVSIGIVIRKCPVL